MYYIIHFPEYMFVFGISFGFMAYHTKCYMLKKNIISINVEIFLENLPAKSDRNITLTKDQFIHLKYDLYIKLQFCYIYTRD